MLHANTSFVANWLKSRVLTDSAQELLSAGEDVYKIYFANLHRLRTPKFRIETWDAGWWQIRNALTDEDLAQNELKQVAVIKKRLGLKLLGKIYEYGFITAELDTLIGDVSNGAY